jgi:glycosyltransferase involved in cell wall biosynthesis
VIRNPRISVVIPVFNGEAFLGDAIASVLAQSEPALEILVVDDGSTDNSASIAERFGEPVRVFRQTNRGHVAARNLGLTAARGDYITTLDADDLFTPDKFALQAGRLDRNPEIDVVIGQLSYLRPESASGGEGFGAFSEHHDDHLTLSLSGCIFRRRVFDRVGLPDETMRFCDDWDWFMRAREAGIPLLLHRHVVVQQRLHTNNMTRQREVVARFTLETMRRSLARRRSGITASTSLPPLADFFEPDEEQP